MSQRPARRVSSVSSAVLAAWCVISGTASADWSARPGTVKMFVKKVPDPSQTTGRLPVPRELLRVLAADLVDEQDSYLVAQLPIPNASAAPQILRRVAEVVEIVDNFDIVDFAEIPLDARVPQPGFPAPWSRPIPLAPPARDAFIVQFASLPQAQWVDRLRSSGVTVVEYLPRNAYLVISDSAILKRLSETLPLQLVRVHQPFHKLPLRLREAVDSSVDVIVTIANVPESEIAVQTLRANTIKALEPPRSGGDRTYFAVTLSSLGLAQLAALPAVVSISPRGLPRMSGQRETHLTLGDTLVSNVSGLLRPIQTDHRTWIASKGISNYKTSLKVAILDGGFDIDGGPDVHGDFRDSSGMSFIQVLPYTRTVVGNNADCYGHATMLASVLAGNAGDPDGIGPLAPPSDIGNSSLGDGGGFYLGRGVVPELPLIMGRIWNQQLSQAAQPIFDPKDWNVIYGDVYSRGARIVVNSWNFADNPSYDANARIQDQAVRSANGTAGGPQMTVYFSAGNTEGSTTSTLVSTPATAKNVITVGGSENYNLSTYNEPT